MAYNSAYDYSEKIHGYDLNGDTLPCSTHLFNNWGRKPYHRQNYYGDF